MMNARGLEARQAARTETWFRRPRVGGALALTCMLLGALVSARGEDAGNPLAAALIEVH